MPSNLVDLTTPEETLPLLNDFRATLAAAKASPPGEQYAWYPYNTSSVWPTLVPLLGQQFERLQHTLRHRPVLDIGCGDGDLSFFLSHLGCGVTAVDHPWFNYNFMHGVKTLKQRLGSDIEICEMNLDAEWSLPTRDYGLVLFLGLLYHLRNPFFVLDQLARQARYCLLSTRIAAVTPKNVPIADEALAYLLDFTEANNDSTNYWIFSEAGLQRLMKRTFWEMHSSVKHGCRDKSNPKDNDRDERIYLLARSRLCSAPAELSLSTGWGEPQPTGWCWVENDFSIDMKLLEQAGAPEFELRIHIPPVSASQGAITLSCRANDVELSRTTYQEAGDHVYRSPLPASVDRTKPIQLRFSVGQPNQSTSTLRLIVSRRNEVSGTNSPVNFWIA